MSVRTFICVQNGFFSNITGSLSTEPLEVAVSTADFCLLPWNLQVIFETFRWFLPASFMGLRRVKHDWMTKQQHHINFHISGSSIKDFQHHGSSWCGHVLHSNGVWCERSHEAIIWRPLYMFYMVLNNRISSGNTWYCNIQNLKRHGSNERLLGASAKGRIFILQI